MPGDDETPKSTYILRLPCFWGGASVSMDPAFMSTSDFHEHVSTWPDLKVLWRSPGWAQIASGSKSTLSHSRHWNVSFFHIFIHQDVYKHQGRCEVTSS